MCNSNSKSKFINFFSLHRSSSSSFSHHNIMYHSPDTSHVWHWLCAYVVVAHRGWGPASLQPSNADGGNPEIPWCHSYLQLHPGSNVCNALTDTVPNIQYTHLWDMRTCVAWEPVSFTLHVKGVLLHCEVTDCVSAGMMTAKVSGVSEWKEVEPDV